MYGAAIKKTLMAIFIAFPLSSIMSCGSNQSEEEAKAEKILTDVKTLYSDKKYDEAMKMIDSLMKSYPGMIDMQRKAMHVQTLIIEKQTINDSIDNEAFYLKNKTLADSLLGNFKFVKTEDMVEGYHVPKSVNPDGLIYQNGIEARVGENSGIYLVSSLHGVPIRHTRLEVSADGETVSTKAVPTGNSRNYRFKNDGRQVEMVTFNTAECDSLCSFVSNNRTKAIRLCFIGKYGKQAMALPDRTKKEIAEAYELDTIQKNVRSAEINRLKFYKKLQLTRKQIKQTATNIQGNRE